MGNTCENCGKFAASTIEFNSVVICPSCFDKEVARIASEMVQP